MPKQITAANGPIIMNSRFFMVLLSLSSSAALVVSGCASAPSRGGIGTYEAINEAPQSVAPTDYKIGALDVLKISVFQEPDLSLDEVPVDASGNVLLPLIGQVTAAGRTSSELSRDVADRLGGRFLVNPQVSINIIKSVSQRVTVEGAVEKPGVYPIEGVTSLLQAMALAEGPSNVAKTKEIIVFRNIDGKTFGAQFNLNEIRRGNQPNPQILGGDIVVVGYSSLKGFYRDLLEIAPLLTTTFIQL